MCLYHKSWFPNHRQQNLKKNILGFTQCLDLNYPTDKLLDLWELPLWAKERQQATADTHYSVISLQYSPHYLANTMHFPQFGLQMNTDNLEMC